MWLNVKKAYFVSVHNYKYLHTKYCFVCEDRGNTFVLIN